MAATGLRRETLTAKLIYTLYLLIPFFGISGVVAIVLAYNNERRSDDWLKSHYRFQVRTFWLAVISFALAVAAAAAGLGAVPIAMWMIWLVIRCLYGLHFLRSGNEVPNPDSLMFGK